MTKKVGDSIVLMNDRNEEIRATIIDIDERAWITLDIKDKNGNPFVFFDIDRVLHTERKWYGTVTVD